MNKIEAVRYLKEQGKDAELIDGVVMLTTTKTGAASYCKEILQSPQGLGGCSKPERSL